MLQVERKRGGDKQRRTAPRHTRAVAEFKLRLNWKAQTLSGSPAIPCHTCHLRPVRLIPYPASRQRCGTRQDTSCHQIDISYRTHQTFFHTDTRNIDYPVAYNIHTAVEKDRNNKKERNGKQELRKALRLPSGFLPLPHLPIQSRTLD